MVADVPGRIRPQTYQPLFKGEQMPKLHGNLPFRESTIDDRADRLAIEPSLGCHQGGAPELFESWSPLRRKPAFHRNREPLLSPEGNVGPNVPPHDFAQDSFQASSVKVDSRGKLCAEFPDRLI